MSGLTVGLGAVVSLALVGGLQVVKQMAPEPFQIWAISFLQVVIGALTLMGLWAWVETQHPLVRVVMAYALVCVAGLAVLSLRRQRG